MLPGPRKGNDWARINLANTSAAIVATNERGIIEGMNRAGELLFGFHVGEVMGRDISLLFAATQAHDPQCIGAPSAKGECGFPREITGQRKDGTTIPMLQAVIEGIVSGRGRLLRIIQDLSDCRVHRSRLRALTSQLIASEERERRRAAADLHDQIGQTLALTKIKLSAVCEALNGAPAARAVAEARDLVNQAIVAARVFTSELGSTLLHEAGFAAALQSLAKSMMSRHSLGCDFVANGELASLCEDVKIALYRAARELLINVIKHARASRVRVVIERNAETLLLRVEDDGIGFDLRGNGRLALNSDGFGLASIRDRLTHLGGSMQVDSAPARGTRVTLIAPLLVNTTSNERAR